MQSWLAAGDLQQVGLPLALHQQVQHTLDLLETAGPRERGRRARKAGGTGEVAVLVHLEDREAAVLLVVRAKAAIVGTALVDAGMELERDVAGLQEIAAALPIARLRRDQRFLDTMLGATLEVKDGLALLDDLRGHQHEAGLAERGGLAQEDIGPRLSSLGGQARSGAELCDVVHWSISRRVNTTAYATSAADNRWNRLKGPITVP